MLGQLTYTFTWEPLVFLAASSSGFLLAMSAAQVKRPAIGIILALGAIIYLAFLDLTAYQSATTIGLVLGCIAAIVLVAFKRDLMHGAIVISLLGAGAGVGEVGWLVFQRGIRLLLLLLEVVGPTYLVANFIFLEIGFLILAFFGLVLSKRQQRVWPACIALVIFTFALTDGPYIPIAIALLLGFIASHNSDALVPHFNAYILVTRFTVISCLITIYYEILILIFDYTRCLGGTIAASIGGPCFPWINYPAVGVFSVPAYWYLGVRAGVLSNVLGGKKMSST